MITTKELFALCEEVEDEVVIPMDGSDLIRTDDSDPFRNDYEVNTPDGKGLYITLDVTSDNYFDELDNFVQENEDLLRGKGVHVLPQKDSVRSFGISDFWSNRRFGEDGNVSSVGLDARDVSPIGFHTVDAPPHEGDSLSR